MVRMMIMSVKSLIIQHDGHHRHQWCGIDQIDLGNGMGKLFWIVWGGLICVNKPQSREGCW